ncbi:hypothetical protein HanRHA438_Chr06g0276891 [Helianthus annuus]|nr:hypothetical protein HanRHA438_Chr06g0276891 [Helianthus annuus]
MGRFLLSSVNCAMYFLFCFVPTEYGLVMVFSSLVMQVPSSVMVLQAQLWTVVA